MLATLTTCFLECPLDFMTVRKERLVIGLMQSHSHGLPHTQSYQGMTIVAIFTLYLKIFIAFMLTSLKVEQVLFMHN